MKTVILLLQAAVCVMAVEAQHVGIGTTTPAAGLEMKGTGLMTQQRITDITSGNSLVLQSGAGQNLKITGYNYNTGTAQPLYLSVDGANTLLNSNGGLVGIARTPTAGYRLDVNGPVKTESGVSTHFVAQTTGGVNSWARLYVRSNSQSWFVGTSEGFLGNQLYIADETFGATRFSIQPNGGPVYMQGHLTHHAGSYGSPRAMLVVNANSSIARCYNGVTGATSGGCGFTVQKAGTGDFRIGIPFDVSQSFVALSVIGPYADMYSTSHNTFTNEIAVYIASKDQFETKHLPTDLPFSIIVY